MCRSYTHSPIAHHFISVTLGLFVAVTTLANHAFKLKSRDLEVVIFPACPARPVFQLGWQSVWQSGWKICSIGRPNTFEKTKANGKDGSYLPFSMAMMVWRETPAFSARVCWLQPRSFRRSLRQFFIETAMLPRSGPEPKARP